MGNTDPLPGVVDLIDNENRCHFRYVDPASLDGDDMVSRSGDTASSVSTNGQVKTILDLGTAPLQRIIFEMKHMAQNTSEINRNFNSAGCSENNLVKEARAIARAAGLASYCEYLQNTGHQGNITHLRDALTSSHYTHS